MHVQSNRTRTRVHLYCTHSISDVEPLAAYVGELSNKTDHDNGSIFEWYLDASDDEMTAWILLAD